MSILLSAIGISNHGRPLHYSEHYLDNQGPRVWRDIRLAVACFEFCWFELGMMDIARQTVEFLYEDTGSIPQDLHLPTLEEIKEDVVKFSIDRLRKGTMVVIKQESLSTPATIVGGATTADSDPASLPKFAVPSMLKTFGLTGTVLDIDQVIWE